MRQELSTYIHLLLLVLMFVSVVPVKASAEDDLSNGAATTTSVGTTTARTANTGAAANTNTESVKVESPASEKLWKSNVGFETTNPEVTLKPGRGHSDKDIVNLNSNNYLVMKFGLSYRDIGLLFSAPLKSNSEDDDNRSKGRSAISDFRFSYAREQTQMEIYDSKTDGFYLTQNGSDKKVVSRGDIYHKSRGFSWFYAFPFSFDPTAKPYSLSYMNKTFSESEHHWDFLFSYSYNETTIRGERPLAQGLASSTTSSSGSSFGNLLNGVESRRTSVLVGAGYTYSLSSSSIFNTQLLVGPSFGRNLIYYEDQADVAYSAGSATQFRFAWVNTWDRHVLSWKLLSDSWTSQAYDVDVQSTLSSMSLIYSYLF